MHSYCDRVTHGCVHQPVDGLCAPGEACFSTGCSIGAYGVTGGLTPTLYSVALPKGAVSELSVLGVEPVFDIALSPGGVLYGVTAGALYTFDTATGAAKLVAAVDRELQALDFSPDGATLYGAGSNVIFTLDPTTGALGSLVNFPTGYSSSGDVAVLGTTLYATATDDTSDGGSDDILVAVDLSASPASLTNLGSTGHTCIWGLGAREGALYGFTCLGLILVLDTTTAAATIVSKSAPPFIGASAR
jgi:hypothetical protein